MDVIKEVKTLALPLGKYVIVGSGPMAARGLKEAHDIDIVVMPEVFAKFKTTDWQAIPWSYSDHPRQIFLRKGDFEMYLDVNCGNFWPTTEELIARADIIAGIPFASLEDTIAFKMAYGREKDAKDIAVIRKYLNNSET